MKNIIKYLIIALFLSLSIGTRTDAQEKDTMAVVTLANLNVPASDTISFDLFINRRSDNWELFANSTFELDITNENFELDPAIHGIELADGTTILDNSAFTGSLPTSSYYITPRIIDGRISVTIAGPDSSFDCEPIPDRGDYRLGSFKLFTKDGSAVPIDPQFTFLTPFYYWQACAYKRTADSIENQSLIWALNNDNIEMDDGRDKYVDYHINGFIPPEMILDTFFVRYDGSRKVYAYWRTSKEAFNEGFILRRAYRPIRANKHDLNYNVLVASFEGNDPRESALVGLGTRDPGQSYEWAHDTVPRRAVEYCYELSYKHFDGNEYVLARECLPIPNAVITYAQARPNPFSGSTRIHYTLDDNVVLTADVYDLEGKKVQRLIENPNAQIGNHVVEFNAPQLSVQGVYNVIFIAYPIDDQSVELSRAIVKIQLVE